MVKDYRFIGIAPEVDLKERGSALLNKRTEPFTFDEMRGYKVFTALLTQSGGDDTIGLNSGNLTIGVTYEISYVGRENYDFTNVGAPNNNYGTKFVATGITPNSWGIGGSSDDLLAYNTGAPVATVLENTIGNVWFTYSGVGIYKVHTTNEFDTSKTIYSFELTTLGTYIYSSFDDSGVFPLTLNSTDVNGDVDGYIFQRPIEIRVYN